MDNATKRHHMQIRLAKMEDFNQKEFTFYRILREENLRIKQECFDKKLYDGNR